MKAGMEVYLMSLSSGFIIYKEIDMSGIGGMVGGIVGGIFGGPIGAQIGSMIGSEIDKMLNGLISQHGQSNVQGAMSNGALGSLVNQLTQAIQGMAGIPQFQKDALCDALEQVSSGCPQQPTTPGCQNDVNDKMGGFIDKLVEKIVEKLMDEMRGGGCNSSSSNGGGSVGESSGSSSCPSPMPSDDDDEVKKGGKSWLVVLAEGMAKVATDHLHKMLEAQDEMEASGEIDDEKKSSEAFTKAQSKFQAESKLFSMAIEANSTALKAVGDGLASLARKQ
ncbi:MAG: hypothetical protein N0C84_08600 [Candidatus Thiodiazotropha taylori]|uniref:Uncharacterized protein n=1 Tax=Candidatus Thiodiazotropha taylori TaxID=2792791 RepID=A0A9E4KCU8_9GAMM|nr:hypothetical protein [Candidatus Thiodiazotropha taylori]MCG7954879.1 hypothetical protein [Candidatus Thiodiazotropha taylori]MCW4240253.1 hypothetical protein [Candidatus Thiodiazotropha taylori]MCW4256506.1 hypothetical protein [Candidatus Thiodiazotropha taylori]